LLGLSIACDCDVLGVSYVFSLEGVDEVGLEGLEELGYFGMVHWFGNCLLYAAECKVVSLPLTKENSRLRLSLLLFLVGLELAEPDDAGFFG